MSINAHFREDLPRWPHDTPPANAPPKTRLVRHTMRFYATCSTPHANGWKPGCPRLRKLAVIPVQRHIFPHLIVPESPPAGGTMSAACGSRWRREECRRWLRMIVCCSLPMYYHQFVTAGVYQELVSSFRAISLISQYDFFTIAFITNSSCCTFPFTLTTM